MSLRSRAFPWFLDHPRRATNAHNYCGDEVPFAWDDEVGFRFVLDDGRTFTVPEPEHLLCSERDMELLDEPRDRLDPWSWSDVRSRVVALAKSEYIGVTVFGAKRRTVPSVSLPEDLQRRMAETFLGEFLMPEKIFDIVYPSIPKELLHHPLVPFKKR